MSQRSEALESRLERLEAHLLADPRLAREYLQGRTEFFHGRFDPRRFDADPLARRRYLEWFLLERVTPGVAGLGVEQVHEARAAELDEADFLALRDSLVGVFEVTGVQAGEGLWLRDLTSGGEYPVTEEAASNVVSAGDLIAGRIFPLGDGLHALSRAAAYYRNPALREALRTDLARARERQRGVLRIRQKDLEGMFFAVDMAGAPADPVGDVRALLTGAGVEQDEIEAWLADLASTPFRRERIVVGADDALGPILDRLAFDTSVDLEGARRALIHAWEHLTTQGPGTGPSLEPAARRRGELPTPDVARAVAAFEERRRQGAPAEELLGELERELALDEVEDESAEAEDEAAPDFPGVVGAMVTEFLWETSTLHGVARAREFESLTRFGRFAHGIGVFENLSERDLTTYAAWWLPENGDLHGADEARAHLAALASFCRWADEVHETNLVEPFATTLQALSTSLPRVVEANRRRTRRAEASQGELFEVLAVHGERVEVRDRRGETSVSRVEPDLATWLRAGDRLRAHRHEDSRLAVYCCYPPEAGLLEATLGANTLDASDEDDE